MNTTPCVDRDERTAAVENEGIKLAYNFVVYALLFDVMYRSWYLDEAAWDLLAFVILGGAIIVAYQAKNNAFPKSGLKLSMLVACIGGVIAFFVAALFVLLK